MRISVLLAYALTAGLALADLPASEPEDLKELWQDPTFQKQFLGSYGVQAELEPRVSPIEREQMEKILPLMGSDMGAAAQALEAVVTPESSAVLDFTLGNIYFQQDKLEEAAQRYRTAVSKFPSFRRAHKNLGVIQVRTGQLDEAIRSLGRVIELGGGDGTTFGLLGYACAARERFTSAESAYRSAVLLQPDVVEWKLGLASSVLRQQKYGEAVTLYEELIHQYPDRADLWMLQASAYVGLDQPLKAAENYEVLGRMGKASAPSLHTLGDIYVNASLWDLARRAYAQAVEVDPGQSLDRPLRDVEILAQRGAVPQARALLENIQSARGADLDEDQRKRILKLEARMSVVDGAGSGATEVLERIVALDPLDGEVLMLLGQHYAAIDQPERAIFYYERAESLEAFEADAKVRHAQLLVRQSHYADAVPLLKRAQEIKPRDEVARFLEQVERLSRTQRPAGAAAPGP